MCIAIPMQVEIPLGDTAWCTGRDGRQIIDLALVGPQPAGAWLLTFLGAAREVITAEMAGNTDRALDALAAVLAGDATGIDDAFADLIGRTPELPEHLRPKEST
ncbi:MAG: HypC/HybG/HupF family hydrogenase formation chaperone [Betaproteobacteria bacterium]|nr:HypC/HybG/HupF family hydrogenase formation chaperone [Betaproteobacteria bacterium]